MLINQGFKPTPSDFANYVFCGVQWVYNHGPNHIRGPGKDKNEISCIKWILKEFKITEHNIIFDGTGINDYEFLSANVNPAGIINCKPDLIVSKNNENILIEFKSVKKQRYLTLPEFDSVHAQVWCYTKIKDLPISKYYLLRYFEDPNKYSFIYSPYSFKKLTTYELNDFKFGTLFYNYIETIELLKSCYDTTKEKIIKSDRYKDVYPYLISPPKVNAISKCSGCIYKIRNICRNSVY